MVKNQFFMASGVVKVPHPSDVLLTKHAKRDIFYMRHPCDEVFQNLEHQPDFKLEKPVEKTAKMGKMRKKLKNFSKSTCNYVNHVVF